MSRRQSARRVIEPGGFDVRSRGDERAREYKLEFITPMFGGGVRLRGGTESQYKDPDPVTPVRGSALRGQLRAWWRRTSGVGLDIAQLRAREAVLWGWAGPGADDAPSAVRVTVDARELSTKPEQVSADRQPSYGIFPLRGQGRDTPDGFTHYYAGRFRVTLALELSHSARNRAKALWPDAPDIDTQLDNEVERAWTAFVTFGGLGGRTRRGFGAVKQIAPEPERFETVLAQLGWADRVAFSPPTKRFEGPDDAHHFALGKLQDFRQGKDVGRNPGQGRFPGRSRWPEPDALRRLTGQHASQHRPEHPVDRMYPRAAFGLPIVFHFKDRGEPRDQILQPADRDRLASPLVLRPVVDGDRTIAVALRLPEVGEPLADTLRHLEVKEGNRGRPCGSGLLNAEAQALISPLAKHRDAPAAGVDAVFKPFFLFFAQ